MAKTQKDSCSSCNGSGRITEHHTIRDIHVDCEKCKAVGRVMRKKTQKERLKEELKKEG